MKRIVLAALLSNLTAASFAQGLVQLTDEEGHVVNGTVILADCGFSTDTVSLFSRLTGSVPRTVNVRRYEMWPVPGTNNFFCWGVCYLPVSVGTNPTWDSQHYVDMNPNATYNNFHAYHQSQGNTSTMRYKFVWYDVANPQGPDSSWVDIDFCGLVSVPETRAAQPALAVWPSPSEGRDLQIDFTADRAGQTRVVLYNMLGGVLRQANANPGNGRVAWSTNGLEAGVYFATLEQDGKALITRRVVITR